MAHRIQEERKSSNKKEDVEALNPNPTQQEIHDKKMAELDEILDEIDSVLEENAETFVTGFIQKGGE